MVFLLVMESGSNVGSQITRICTDYAQNCPGTALVLNRPLQYVIPCFCQITSDFIFARSVIYVLLGHHIKIQQNFNII